jgi:hypothetical protein
MLKAVCSTSRAERQDVADSVQLTFPISFELADESDDGRARLPTRALPADEPSSAPLSDAMREMMAWSPWTARPPVRSAPRAASGRPPQGDEEWQVRVEMTVDDAEALVEGLCSLIAEAKEHATAQQAATSPALAFAGTKIGADYKAAPPRFSSAQLEALSRKPAKRRLVVEQEGRLVHQLFASGRIEKRLPS